MRMRTPCARADSDRPQRDHRERRGTPVEPARAGAQFASQTDSEIFAHLIAAQAGAQPGDDGKPLDLEEAVRLALKAVVGTYGLAVIDARSPDRLVVARNGSPVLLGIGDKEMFAASDVAALVRYTRQVVHLDDGEIATLRPDGFRTSTLDAQRTTKQPAVVEADAGSYDADGQRTSCTRRFTSSRAWLSGSCAGGWMTGSTQRTWAASTWIRATLAASSG